MDSVTDQSVGMGQVAMNTAPGRLHAVLGSCVGVAMCHPRRGVGMLAHVVLPEAQGRGGAPGKFADTAVPWMLARLVEQGVSPSGLVVKIAGGACMFAASGPMQIGQANIEAVVRTLEAAGLRVAARDVGGTAGRRVTLDCQTGELTIQSAGGVARKI